MSRIVVMGIHAEVIDWDRLFREFDRFEPEEESRDLEASLFASSLMTPVPDFVHRFIQRRLETSAGMEEAVKALYSFLLEKRYEERLNLLHFAFHIFDEHTQLPQEVVDRTPFPHEDGVPRFTHINDPNFEIEIGGSD